MGITKLRLQVANPSVPSKTETVEFIVDSGTLCSVVPAPILKRLKIRATATEEFRFAEGSTIVRRKGAAMFKHGKKTGLADVVFGEDDDATLLGALTLEALGLVLDPLTRELKPFPMALALQE